MIMAEVELTTIVRKNTSKFKLKEKENAVYIGTNVEYAIYVHEGTLKLKSNRFLKNAVIHNEEQIKKINVGKTLL